MSFTSILGKKTSYPRSKTVVGRGQKRNERSLVDDSLGVQSTIKSLSLDPFTPDSTKSKTYKVSKITNWIKIEKQTAPQ